MILTLCQLGCIGIVDRRSGLQDAQRKLEESQSRTRELAYKRLDEAINHEYQFYNCMTGYAQGHSAANASATEIAEAGLSECRRPLDEYSYDITTYFDLMGTASMTSINQQASLSRMAKENAQKQIDKVTESGKRKAIGTVIGNRK